jgi:hypothetical protein
MSAPPKNRVFISSTTEDLKEHRAAVIDVLLRLEQEPVLLESPPADDRPVLELSRRLIESCDLFIGLIAWRYGFGPRLHNPDGRSYVELEHLMAWEAGKPVLAFMASEDAVWSPRYIDGGELGERQRRFRQDVQSRVTVGRFTSPEDLIRTVSVSLARWLTERQSPSTAVGSVATSRRKTDQAKEVKGAAPEALPDDIDPFELAWRLVVDRKADPALLRHLDEEHLKKAVDDWAREHTTATAMVASSMPDLYRTAQEQLRKKQSGLAPHPLWLAWIRTTRPSFGRARAVPAHV